MKLYLTLIYFTLSNISLLYLTLLCLKTEQSDCMRRVSVAAVMAVDSSQDIFYCDLRGLRGQQVG